LAVRAVLGFAQAGAWGAEWYRLYQDWPNKIYDSVPEQFATMALLRQIDDSAKVIKRTLVGDYFKQLSQFGEYIFTETIRSDSLRILKFKKASKEMYAIWAVEKVKISPQTNRPVYVERKGSYSLNVKGKLYTFKDDGTGTLSTQDFNGGMIYYDANPKFIEVDK